jgi:hypothetical protein
VWFNQKRWEITEKDGQLCDEWGNSIFGDTALVEPVQIVYCINKRLNGEK